MSSFACQDAVELALTGIALEPHRAVVASLPRGRVVLRHHASSFFILLVGSNHRNVLLARDTRVVIGRAGLKFPSFQSLRGLIQCRPFHSSRTRQQPFILKAPLHPVVRPSEFFPRFIDARCQLLNQPLSLSLAWIYRDGHERASFVRVDGAAFY